MSSDDGLVIPTPTLIDDPDTFARVTPIITAVTGEVAV